MSKEYEAKFLDIDVIKMRKKLKDIGAKIEHPRKKYFRSVDLRCAKNGVRGYARVRDEAGKTTMTVKLFKDPKFPEEYELSINEDFETAMKFMEALGIEKKAFQESYREKWSHPLAHELTFDTIPGIPTYMEVDAESEENLNKLIKMLDLDKSKMRFGAFDKTYKEYYGIPRDVLNDETPSLTFKNIVNEIRPTKNLELFRKIAIQQKELGFGKFKKSRKKRR